MLTADATTGPDSGMDLTFARDRYGNRWSQTATGTGGGGATQPSLTFNGNNNRIDGYQYDAAGNLLNDGLNQYAYDAAGVQMPRRNASSRASVTRDAQRTGENCGFYSPKSEGGA